MTPVIFQNQPTVADRFGPDDQAGYGSAEARSSYWWCVILVSDRWRCDLSCGRSSDLRALLIAGFIRRVSFVNNGWRELKETPSSNWKIPCLAIIGGLVFYPQVHTPPELVSRFILCLVSKKLRRELYLREPATLLKARQLAGYVTEIEEGRRRRIDDAALGTGGLPKTVETLARRLDKMEVTRELPSRMQPTQRAMACFECGDLGHIRRGCPQLRVRTRLARASNSGTRDRRLLEMSELQAGQSPSVAGRVNGLEISLLLDSGVVVSVVPLSTWRYFKHLSEFLVLISEMLLEGGYFLPEVEDDNSLIRIICFSFRTLVFSYLHCAVLETSSDPFRSYCHALQWSECYFTYPLHWIDEIMVEFQNDQLLSNISRRSADLPYLISGCLSNLASDSVEQGITVFSSYDDEFVARRHNFRESCHPHLRIGMITAIYAMGDQDWSVRNSANYLFSILLIRIFVSPKQRSLSTSGNYKSDAIVTRKQSDFHFFSTFYGLADIMLELLEQCLLGSWNQSSISSAFSVLTVLTHLYPFKFSLSQ
ncbi:hypothetical protein T07_7528 [Trichinella nelsoni]|uniref:CCHC-type domain-containing protein n=1 Tax=Trichinella nelsoni TaxID=6336 RepID=A0A0V0RZP9_9BILA|nr:hypothetical protein T07_7528 [Trichinella nelsoni]